MKIAGFLFALALCASPAFGEQERFYVTSSAGHASGNGIYQATLDTQTGKLGPVTLAAPVGSPSFLALGPEGHALYVVAETPGTGQIQAFGRRPDGGLFPLNQQSANGNGPCYVSVDPSGRLLFIANYNSGNIVCFRLQHDGSVGPLTAVVPFNGSGPDARRQATPHAHSIYASPDHAFVYACDLGSDRVWVFKLDAAAGTLTPNNPPSAQVPSGSGPRHLVFSRDGAFVYVASEIGHSVTAFARNTVTGNLTPLQTLDVLPDEKAAGIAATAEIVLHPSGKWLYVSNRGCDTVSVFAIGATGRLKLVQSISAGVKYPRSFDLDPTGQWIITAGQRDNRLAVLKIDPASGQLSPTTQSAQVDSPTCLLFESN